MLASSRFLAIGYKSSVRRLLCTVAAESQRRGEPAVTFLLGLQAVGTMAQSAPPPFDPSRPPLIEGFLPTAIKSREESFGDRFLRKTRENPLVPLGCLGTAGVLTYGLICFKRGNTRQSQLMMRARILAQGFTVAALVVGVVVTALKPQK